MRAEPEAISAAEQQHLTEQAHVTAEQRERDALAAQRDSVLSEIHHTVGVLRGLRRRLDRIERRLR